MRPIPTCLLFSGIFLSAACGRAPQQEEPPSASAAQAIRDTVIALDRAMNHAVDSLDCAKGMSYIADQPPVFFSNGHAVMTRSELLDLCQKMDAPRSGAEFDPDTVVAYVLGPDAAYVVHRGQYTVHLKNGATRDERLLMTTIWQRSDSGWRMVHLHESGIPDTTGVARKPAVTKR
jgi:ketosteroid isomerase-like protein